MPPSVSWTIPDPVPQSVYDSIAAQILEDPEFPSSYQGGFEQMLAARHLLYWKTIPPTVVNGKITNYGDCGNPQAALDLGSTPGDLAALSDIGIGVSAAGTATSVATSALGGAAAAAAATGGLLGIVPIVGTIAGPIITLIASIFQHHEQAVAKEEGTLCGCCASFNQYLDAVDAAVFSGEISPAAGMQYLNQLQGQFLTCIQPVTNACVVGDSNAACVYKGHVNGQVLLRQWLYNNLSSPPAPAIAEDSAAPVAGAVASWDSNLIWYPGYTSVGGNVIGGEWAPATPAAAAPTPTATAPAVIVATAAAAAPATASAFSISPILLLLLAAAAAFFL
jgi:hypothetical protein